MSFLWALADAVRAAVSPDGGGVSQPGRQRQQHQRQLEDERDRRQQQRGGGGGGGGGDMRWSFFPDDVDDDAAAAAGGPQPTEPTDHQQQPVQPQPTDHQQPEPTDHQQQQQQQQQPTDHQPEPTDHQPQPTDQRPPAPETERNRRRDGLGPERPPCRACTDFRTFAADSRRRGGLPQQQRQPTTSAGEDQHRRQQRHDRDGPEDDRDVDPDSEYRRGRGDYDCPPDRDLLGRSAWTLLHAAAAAYPDRPSPEHRRHARRLLDAVAALYPCADCGRHFADTIRRHPPDTGSRDALALWTCRAHNAVNRRLGKPPFDCAAARLRWLDGPADGRCG